MRKILVLSALLILMVSFNVFAQNVAPNNVVTNVNFDVSTSILAVCVSDGVDVGSDLAVSVYRPNFTSDTITQENIGNAVLFFDSEKYTGSDMCFYSFILDDEPSGYYTVEISIDGTLVPNIEPIYFSSEKEKAQLVTNLNKELDYYGISETKDSTEICKLIKDKNLIFQFDLEGVYKTNASLVVDCLYNVREELYEGKFDELSYVAQGWKKALALANLNIADVDTIEGVWDEITLNLDISLDCKDESKSAILRAITYQIENYKSGVKISDIKELLERAIVLGVVNTSSRVDMTDVIKTNYKILEIDVDKYLKLDVIEVNKALVEKEFKSLEDVKKALDNKISAMLSSASSGGGGGVSSKKPSGSSIAINTPVTVPVIQNASANESFGDIQNHWAKDYITYLYDKKIVSGKGHNVFKPDDTISREEFVKIIVSALNVPVLKYEEGVFEDVSSSDWYADYVYTAYKNNIVMGIGNNLFGAGNVITRQDIAVLTTRCFKIDTIGSTSDFNDIYKISDYAQSSVLSLKELGIISGRQNNNFEPEKFSTRAEACKIIYLSLMHKEVR